MHLSDDLLPWDIEPLASAADPNSAPRAHHSPIDRINLKVNARCPNSAGGDVMVLRISLEPPAVERSEDDVPGVTDGTAESFTLFKATVEAIGDAVVVTTPELERPGPRIHYVNPAFTRMTGYAADEVVGRTPRLFQGSGTDRAELDRLRACLLRDKTFQGEVVNYRKDGQEHVIEWLVTAIKDGDGRTLHWLSVQRDVTERKRLEHRQELLVGELHHRTRNLLAVVGTIAARTLPSSPERDVFDARLAALGRVQSFLSASSDWSIPLADLLRAELEAVGGGGSGLITVDGPSVELPGDKVQTVALALHELVTNAVKHGALADPSGRLTVCWRIVEERGLLLTWMESGVAMVPGSPARRGFGLNMIERGPRYQLDGETTLEFRADGLCCTIMLPTTAFHKGDQS